MIKNCNIVIDIAYKRHVLEVKHPINTVNEKAGVKLGQVVALHEHYNQNDDNLRDVVKEVKENADVQAQSV